MESSVQRDTRGSDVREDLEQVSARLVDRFRVVRGLTESLCGPLSPEDCQAQSMPDASPVKWHLAHTSWFFETFLLEREIAAYEPFHPEFRVLFNSYYQTVGEQHPRPCRGLVTRPSLDEVLDYRKLVDDRVLDLLASPGRLKLAALDIVDLGLHHEQQHQELILTDVKHLFAQNPLHPTYRAQRTTSPGTAPTMRWLDYAASTRWVGADDAGFAFDNERPRHRVLVGPFQLASHLVTNGEFARFVEEGGYQRPEFWLSDGWTLAQERDWQAPLYWEKIDGDWSVLTLGGQQPLRTDEPVCHVSYYEAAAYASWAGCRLPSEIDWEVAAGDTLKTGNFLESGILHPCPTTAEPKDAVLQLFGDVWEWTRSPYGPYPGYQPDAGALGEYNGKFMCNQMVLRGGSCVTPASHIRSTYRNFFPPDARWQFSGFRLARDLPG